MKKFIKRTVAVAIMMAMILVMGMPVQETKAFSDYVYDPSANISITPGEGITVADGAAVLSKGDVALLLEKGEKVAKKHDIYIVIATDYTDIGTSYNASEIAAKNAYDKFADEQDGIIFYVNLNTRDYWFETFGTVDEYITSGYGLGYIEDKCQPLLTDGEYCDAFEEFIKYTDIFVKEGKKGTPYTESHVYKSPTDYVIRVVIGILIGLIIAFVHVTIEKRKLNTKRPQPFAKQYVPEDGFRISQKSDSFMFSKKRVIPLPKNNGSSGGRSGGGRITSSGRGGKF